MASPMHWTAGLWIDLFASAALVVLCVLIFFRTRSFYELTRHEGIRYFRYAFLIFSVTFLAELSRPLWWLIASEHGFARMPLGLFVALFSGTLAILTLLYSVLWKRLKQHVRYPLAMLSILSAAITAAAMVERARLLMLAFHTLMLLVVIVASYLQARSAKKGSRAAQLFLLYALLCASWIVNAAASVLARSSFAIAGLLNVLSAVIFAVLAYKVFRKTAVGRT